MNTEACKTQTHKDWAETGFDHALMPFVTSYIFSELAKCISITFINLVKRDTNEELIPIFVWVKIIFGASLIIPNSCPTKVHSCHF